MCGSVGPDQAGAIDRKPHGQSLQSNIMDHLVVAALQKGRIDGRKRLHPAGGETRGEDHGVLFGDADIEQVVTRTLEAKPKAATHWSTRGLAAELGLSQSTVGRIWRAFGLKPHRAETFKLSSDPFFVEKVRDVVGLYMSPPENAIVLCVDEKSQVQALDRTQPLLPMEPGQAERGTHDELLATSPRYNEVLAAAMQDA